MYSYGLTCYLWSTILRGPNGVTATSPQKSGTSGDDVFVVMGCCGLTE